MTISRTGSKHDRPISTKIARLFTTFTTSPFLVVRWVAVHAVGLTTAWAAIIVPLAGSPERTTENVAAAIRTADLTATFAAQVVCTENPVFSGRKGLAAITADSGWRVAYDGWGADCCGLRVGGLHGTERPDCDNGR
jgi:hypothetical protein